MNRVLRYGIAATLIGLFFATNIYAAEPANSGLLISPPRYSVDVAAGSSDSQDITIADYTKNPLDITLSIQQFSVADLSYEYQIKQVDEPWLKLEQTELHLEAGKSQTLKFTAQPPANATPGGKYYLIVASAVSKNGDLTSTMQVAAPVYITVKGNLNTSSKLLDNHDIRRIAFGGDIPFKLDIKNTGNTHYYVDIRGHLDGLFTGLSTTSTKHILLPSTTRHFESSIPAPPLPGIYQATYGYNSDSTGEVQIKTWIVYLPPWSIIAAIIIIWASVVIIRQIRLRRSMPTDSRQ